MTTYTAKGETYCGDEQIIYEGSDPVLAVNLAHTASTSRFLLTWVEEDGVKIPETEAM